MFLRYRCLHQWVCLKDLLLKLLTVVDVSPFVVALMCILSVVPLRSEPTVVSDSAAAEVQAPYWHQHAFAAVMYCRISFVALSCPTRLTTDDYRLLKLDSAPSLLNAVVTAGTSVAAPMPASVGACVRIGGQDIAVSIPCNRKNVAPILSMWN